MVGFLQLQQLEAQLRSRNESHEAEVMSLKAMLKDEQQVSFAASANLLLSLPHLQCCRFFLLQVLFLFQTEGNLHLPASTWT